MSYLAPPRPANVRRTSSSSILLHSSDDHALWAILSQGPTGWRSRAFYLLKEVYEMIASMENAEQRRAAVDKVLRAASRSLGHNYRQIGRRAARHYGTTKEAWEARRSW
ncbi:hypothetical protein JCM10207_006216 [Rhodosporidiobolus poonsookiae]